MGSTLFISYARLDQANVEHFVADARERDHRVLIDLDFNAGESWWERIIDHLQNCTTFVPMISDSSLQSRPWHKEVEYARALHRPFFPIRIGPVTDIRVPPELGSLHRLEYPGPELARQRLFDELALMPTSTPLPSPLPKPPAVPVEYVADIEEALRVGITIPVRRQREYLARLTDARRERDTRDFADQLLARLRVRREVDADVVGGIDAVIGSVRPQGLATETPSGRLRANLGRDTARLPRVAPMWVCAACNTTQAPTATSCVVCGATRDGAVASPRTPAAAGAAGPLLGPPAPPWGPPPTPGPPPPPPTSAPPPWTATPPFGAGPPTDAHAGGSFPPMGTPPVPVRSAGADAWRKLIIWGLLLILLVVVGVIIAVTQRSGY